MSNILNYSIIGLEDFNISFEKYCTPCEIQKYCKYGKNQPFTVIINCSDLNKAKEKVKFDQLQKLQKTEDVSVTYEELVKKVKINLQNIFSQIWQEKVKAQKEEIRCLDTNKVDAILVSQQGQDWWQDFNSTMKAVNGECEKII
jgi:tRNA U34 5-carboxymethylaminomethyl modifying GTPase MnmE/TrmE